MDFGKVADPDRVDFTLPADHSDTAAVLAETRREGVSPEVYVGCAKWSRSDWIGQFYPRGSKASQFLSYYVQQFNSVELNATYHQMPDPGRIASWARQAPEGFLFCPKIYQGISHRQGLARSAAMTEQFLRGVKAFGSALGTIFLQLPPRFSPGQLPVLRDYLEAFPTNRYSLAVEFRHQGWFGDGGAFDEVFAMLKELNVDAVITDTSGRRDVLHQRLTGPQAFIRFVGNNLHPSDYRRLEDWAERIRGWLDGGLRRLYFFMHHPDELHSPKLVSYFIDLLNKRCDLELHVPRLIDSEPSLFD